MVQEELVIKSNGFHKNKMFFEVFFGKILRVLIKNKKIWNFSYKF
jgi:hypothetical protein